MSRLTVPNQSLPRLAAPTTTIIMLLATGTIGAGIALLTHNSAAATLAVIATLLVVAPVIVFHVRTRQRQAILDLYLLKLYAMLGWPAPDRSQVTASRWNGGWAGRPGRLRLRYNPLADESLPEISAEARRLANRAFGVPYKIGGHHERKATLVLVQQSEKDDTSKDAQIERVNTIIAKTFGADAKTSMKFADDGAVREITVKYEVTPRLSSSALRARIESSVSSVLEGRWRAFWDLQHDTVTLEVRPTLASIIPNPNHAPAEVDPRITYDKLEVPIGKDEDGNIISWRPKRDPHGLVTGKTGKGKTVVLLGIIMYLAAHGWKVWGIDGKRIELLGLREWPNVELIAGRIDHQARVGHQMFTMMQQRFEDYEAGRVKLEDFEPVLFVIDEYKTFRNAVTRWFRTVKPKGPGSTAPVLEEISDFVSLARKVRMHLVIGLQRPDAEFLTGDMRDNFNFRVSLGRLSPEGAKMMWDSFSTGVAIPPFAIGRGIAHNAHGAPVEIQTYWTPDPYQTDPEHPEIWVSENDLALVTQLRPKVTMHELQRIIDPDDWADLEDEKSTKEGPDYNDYMASRIVPAGAADQLIRKAAGIYQPADNEQEAARVAVLDRIQTEESEPEISDEEEMFAGYSDNTDTIVEQLLDDSGELALEGAIALIDPDYDTWGLIESAEYDESSNGYIALSYRNFETGEPGSLSVPCDDSLTIRTPKGA